MSRKLCAGLLGLIAIATTLVAHGQDWQSYNVVCTYAPSSPGGRLAAPSARAMIDVRTVTNAIGVFPIAVYEGDVDNAAAISIPQFVPTRWGLRATGRAVPAIVYNRNFMTWIDAQGRWAALSVMAHEVGHHVHNDTSWLGQFKHPWTKELEADFYSGFVLARLGAPLEEAVRAQRAMFDLTGSFTHPDTPRRIDAIEQGWLRGGGRGAIGQRFYALR